MAEWGLTDSFFDFEDALLVPLCYEAHRDTATAGTRCTTYPMCVLLWLRGDIPVDDNGDVLNIETAGADVGGDKHGHDRCAEEGEGREAFALR